MECVVSGEHGHAEYATQGQVNDLNSLVAANIANLSILEGRVTTLETAEPPPPVEPPDPPVEPPVEPPEPPVEPPPLVLSLTFNGESLTELQPNTPYNIQLQGYDTGTGPVTFTDNHGNTNTENFVPWDKTLSTYPPGIVTITVTSPDFTQTFTLNVADSPQPVQPATTFGNPIAAGGLDNTRVMGDWELATAFRPSQTTAVHSLQRWLRGEGTGYGAGTGGQLRYEIRTDTNGLPSDTVLGAVNGTPGIPTGQARFPIITFPTPIPVQVGSLYWIVTRNIDPNPATNYISINSLSSRVGNHPPNRTTTPPEGDVYLWSNGNWAQRRAFTDVLTITFTDGRTIGNGYIEALVRSARPISASQQVRQVFTATKDITISGWALSVGYSRPGTLTGTLRTIDGTLVAEATASSTQMTPIGQSGTVHPTERNYWTDFTPIPPVTLTAGTTYQLLFVTDSSAEFWVHPLRAGDLVYGFSPQTVWTDAHAEETDDGNNWRNFETWHGNRPGDTDLSIEFHTTTPIPPPPGPEPPTSPDVDLILTPGQPVNLTGATDVRIGWEPNTTVGRINLEGAKRIQFLGATPLQVDGTLDAGGPLQTGTVNAWHSEDVELTNIDVLNSPRSAFSIEHATRLTIDRSSAINAWHLGVHGGYLQDVTVRRSLFENNSRRIPTASGDQSEGWESGDLKLTNAHGTIIEDNTCRLGYGPGIWFDIHNTGTRIRRNRVFDKHAEGIFYEISHGDAIIEDNEIRNSPTGLNANRMNWLYGAGILISTSSGVQVLRNTVDGSYHGITVIDQSHRGDTPQGYNAADYLIDHNTIRNVNKVGAAQDSGSMAVFNPAAWGPNNTYENVQQFEWQGGGSPF